MSRSATQTRNISTGCWNTRIRFYLSCSWAEWPPPTRMSHTLYSTYAAPLRLDFGFSRMAASWLIITHTMPLLMLTVLHLPILINAAILLFASVSLVRSWRRHVSRIHPSAIRSASWSPAGELTLYLTNGTQQSVQLASQALILPWLVVVSFKSTWPLQHRLLVTHDMLDSETFRQLRGRLRIAMDAAAE